MRELSIDIETYSDLSLAEVGVYKYADSRNFEILLFAYSYDNDLDNIQIIDLTQEELPENIIKDLEDNSVIKTAFNAAFERTCLARHLESRMPRNTYLAPEAWVCTMERCLAGGLPGRLETAAEALNLASGKMKEGKRLIDYFSKPCKPTKKNGGRTRNLPEHDLDKWKVFKEYCKQDVHVEIDVKKQLGFIEPNENERRLYVLDQIINDCGVKIDLELVNNAIAINEANFKQAELEIKKIANIDNVKSTTQLKKWLFSQGMEVDSVKKDDMPNLIETAKNEDVKKVLELRQEIAKTSIAKYQKMIDCACSDGKIRGLFQFYGASRSGRWAGRLVQVQNLPKNNIKDLDEQREKLLKRDRVEADTLSQLIRTALVGPFVVADFSAIEARVLAWLAGEEWRLEVFRTHGKIYEASAAAMFNVPIESINKQSPLRQKGKIAELALGYQGSVGALRKMGALDMGLKEEELQGIVDAWRSANIDICNYWFDVEDAFKTAIRDGYAQVGPIVFEKHKEGVCITLPSKRQIWYIAASFRRHVEGRRRTIVYAGVNQLTRKWSDIETYGGKLVENIVQAVARDILGETMLQLETEGYPIVMHIHDEVVIENESGLDRVLEIMRNPPTWAKGLPLDADGYCTRYYKKD